MLSIKFIRQNLELVKKGLAAKKEKVDLDALLNLDSQARELKSKVEELRAKRNKQSDEIAGLKRKNIDVQEKIVEVREWAREIKEKEGNLRQIEQRIEVLLSGVPNLPHPSVPLGEGSEDNEVLRQWGELRKFSFSPRTHLQLGEGLDILDFKRAAKMSGSNFLLFKGKGALLERALINFFLDVHRAKGYREIWPPLLVNRSSMFNTGQLPKLEEDMYYLERDDLFLIPTAEVPLTNLYRNEVLDAQNLPLKYVAYTPCFRREAGSYGRETKGLIRVHQFDKVELVKFVKSEDSYDELESLVGDAEEVLQRLGLPYRLVLLCSSELSFASSKCYDLEVFAPGSNAWLEVSSCANFEDFQARRANIKYRTKGGLKYVHTLNGSGIALARTVIALLENYQEENGSVKIPPALQKYINEKEFKK
ncbi:MAG: serine--tRNA ligase [Candidatus Omnitrophica bacterium 4484_213]|nr:MAG: serine--tRNA ligase [Candidatus Omnitrophica bacterium 4484_213]